MKKNNFLFALCVLLYASMFSCSKDYSNAPGGTYSSMEDVFSSLSLQPKTVTIDAAAGGTFYGNSGTRYIFTGNSFQTAGGAMVTGAIQVAVTEYLQKGDMLFSKRLPVSNNEPLLSGGEINVSASQNGQPIYMKPLKTFQANIPQTGIQPSGIALFMGQPNPDTTQFKTNWVPVKPDSNRNNVGIFPNPIGDTLGIISDSLRECNADAFMTAPNFQTFTVTITVTGATLPPSSKVYAYTLYDTYKGEWPLGMIGSYANGVFTEMHVPNIPVHFVAFILINGKFYGGTVGATPATGSNYTLNIKQTDPATFKKQVDAL